MLGFDVRARDGKWMTWQWTGLRARAWIRAGNGTSAQGHTRKTTYTLQVKSLLVAHAF